MVGTPFLLEVRMTYKEFMAGLYVKYHMVYVRSVPFIKFGGVHKEAAGFENLVIAKVDAERVLAGLKNKNMALALCLAAQGYYQWQIAETIGVSVKAISQYVQRFKNILEKV